MPSWHLWQWQATMHLNGKGYKATLEGENKDDATSGEADVRAAYARKNGDLFREILRMFNVKSEAGKTLMLPVRGAGRRGRRSSWSKSLRRGEKGPIELRSRGGPATLDECMMGDIQGPEPHHGTGHDAHSSTGGCQRWSNLAA